MAVTVASTKDYAPILQAIMFCIVVHGFRPRLALESSDGAENRLDKIRGLIEQSKYSIHDLSRCQAKKKGEMFRLNMPFELGIDFGCRQYFGNGREAKKFLILEETRYRFQAALSDISGCDIEAHSGQYDKAMTKVRNWLRQEAGISADGPAKIQGDYVTFQEWNYERKLFRGFSEDDIREYPTFELLEDMQSWVRAGKPFEFDPNA
jgi:hypothetical protein